jgi:hypothetical protein
VHQNPLSTYGPRLSSDEYEQAVVELYRRAAEGRVGAGQGDVAQALKDGEFNLAIDHKLGKNFPAEKRQALLEAKRRAEKQRLRLVGRFIRKCVRERKFASGMQVWLEHLAEAFSKVLSAEELNAFISERPGEKPIFPIEADKL